MVYYYGESPTNDQSEATHSQLKVYAIAFWGLLRYSGPKCSTGCLKHSVFEGRNHFLASYLTAAGEFEEVSNLTETKISSYLEVEVFTSRQFNRH